MPAAFYHTTGEDRSVECLLCPHQCIVKPERYGKCHTRVNRNGELVTENYGVLSAIATDPIEKKPLYHFHPGRPILSIGSYGCNLRCDFCQNCDISQIKPGLLVNRPRTEPEEIVKRALHIDRNIGLAYTYNEPTIFYEFMHRCAVQIKEHGLKNVMVTNGYINEAPLESLLPLIDGFNVDLKSFRDEFYHKRSGGSLEPVLKTIQSVAKSDSHLELTFLLIPEYNDNEEEWREMIEWITDHCGRETVLHVSRYFPRYRLLNPPTPLEKISHFLEVAKESMHYVYAGNAPQLETDTLCPECGNTLISRNMYQTFMKGIGEDGRCMVCNYRISGVYNNSNL